MTVAAAPLGWGVLGTGGIAARFVSDAQATGRTVVAVGSRSWDGASAFARTHRVPKAHDSYDALVNDPGVEVVYVATPHVRHAADALLALRAGKHVLVEKPFALSATEAQEVVDAAASLGLTVMEAMWTRWLPHMVRLRHVVASGVLGDVRLLLADASLLLSRDPDHRLNRLDLGGGALLDLGVYPISFAYDVLGSPRSVSAASSWAPSGVDAATAVLLSYPTSSAALSCAIDACGPNTACVVGTDGRVEISSPWYGPADFRRYDRADVLVERFESPRRPTTGMEYQMDEFEGLVRSSALAGDVLPPLESAAIMGILDQVRGQTGLSFPGEGGDRRLR